MFPPTVVICAYCRVTFVSPFINLRPRRDFTSQTPEREPCITMYKCVLLALPLLFCSGRGSSLVLWAPWHAGSPPEQQVWTLADIRSTCSGGSNSHVPTGSDSEHVGLSRPLQTHVQVQTMSDGSCDIWDLDCRQCR